MTMTADQIKNVTLSDLFTHKPKLVGGAALSAIAIFVGATQLPKIGAEDRTQAAIAMAVTERELVIQSVIDASKAQPGGGVCQGQTISFTVKEPVLTYAGGIGMDRHHYAGTAQFGADGKVYPQVTRLTNDKITKTLKVAPFASKYGIQFSPKCTAF